MKHAIDGKCYNTLYYNSLRAEVYDRGLDFKESERVLQTNRRDTLTILDEMFVKSLHAHGMLSDFIQSSLAVVIISRYVGEVRELPFSVRQVYTINTSANYSATVPYFANWDICTSRHDYISEDKASGNTVWSQSLRCKIRAGTGLHAVLTEILQNNSLMGCIDTLSISSGIFPFETIYKGKCIPLFNVPSAEYLLAQALLSPQEVDELIYAEANPEKACTELVCKLTEGRYSKARTETLLCPAQCSKCRSRTCKGKQLNVLEKIRSYLKDIHSEYTFPWEISAESRTSKFK
ncbi:MAG: hypothetical protein RSC68_00350 [Acinetobacter sp.]